MLNLIGRALGQIIRNLRNPRWVAAKAGKAATKICVVNPAGSKVYASIKHHLHDDNHNYIGDLYYDAQGNYYVCINGSYYRYDLNSNSWRQA
jgi:hypothetical protein